MANALPMPTMTGTIGELLVQLRLLQFNVQAAPPIKDSGNDLIALYGRNVRTIQVKTATGRISRDLRLPAHFDILALVVLWENTLELDRSRIFLLPSAVASARSEKSIAPYELKHDDLVRSTHLVRSLFGNET